MDYPWSTILSNIGTNFGLPINVIESLDIENFKLLPVEKRNVQLYSAKIIQNSTVLMAFKKFNFNKILSISSKVQDVLNYKSDTVIVLPQINNDERKHLLNRMIPFITLEGEFFLPFITTRLNSTRNVPSFRTDQLSTIGQRLFVFITMDIIQAEKKHDTLISASYIKNGLYKLKGGEQFIKDIGHFIGINNRTSFSRAVNDLVEHNLLKVIGETKDREYSITFDSKLFFESGRLFLNSPVSNKEVLISNNKTPQSAIISGNSALSHVTMIAYDGPLTFAVNREQIKEIDKNTKMSFIQQGLLQTNTSDDQIILQSELYDLRPFNKLFKIIIPSYPDNTVDPIHLYMMFQNNPDERVINEADELINKLWGE